MDELDPTFSPSEEASHALTHGIGAVASLFVTFYLVEEALAIGDGWDVAAAVVFGATMVHQYAASTFCHGLPDAWQTQKVFELLDFMGIYALIAATYTPFMVGPLRGPWGFTILALVWLAALVGIVLEIVLRPRRIRLSLALYLGMGWLGIVAAYPLAQRMPLEGMALMVGGGLAYTVGVFFYVWRGFRYHHTVWHLFVLLGSALHAWAVARYAIPCSHA